ncbi:MAG: DUF5658 family protein [Phycisphaerales bacterium]|jgi:hypothetical protein|nr:DUF5658 family protein [Phycisphaerales bacterium]
MQPSGPILEQSGREATDLPPLRSLLYPRLYPWYALMALLDVLVTSVTLRVGGYEANGLAAQILEFAGILGLLVFKLASVVLVIAICEVVGRRREPTARRLAEWAVAITAIPVAVGLVQLAWFAHVLDMSALVGVMD